ncbi:putative Nitroreductase family [Monocercomonoides exilis]|uniref:putative Nitroreductase family n=1 Tax=Monocercomonoides exilis TaxID=2049356 RepID=UPI0035595C02|nr:putative Nitroreductase family [Monocercomonoides exilis]|eukprot:MONOS_2782.1-p1 / transcript=MONOS_2782.1 / gene=MONOS_2782 / organism=Monocercomonoides_exilis_PA203 / gene_product=unspecified product / transcript_product=unspecified product / location=Mono_scaffold00059:112460-113309(+) / protein_length=224 / sequence_SO=supercontig / SO=protein_coding / is_pseudo=false
MNSLKENENEQKEDMLARLSQTETTEILELIKNRRTCRKYLPFQIPEEIALKIVDAGRLAVSARNLQPCVFYLIQNRNLNIEMGMKIEKIALEQLPTCFDGIDTAGALERIFYGAPTVIHIFVRTDGYFTKFVDAGIAFENMLLAAESFGLSTCPCALTKLFGNEIVREYLCIPSNLDLVMSLSIGHPSPDFKKVSMPRRMDNIIIIKEGEDPRKKGEIKEIDN